MKVAAIIVCAGRGKRLKGPDKALLDIGDGPLFSYSVKLFKGIRQIEQIILVLRKENFKIAEKYILGGRITLTKGGPKRKDSVFNGLSALKPEIDYVLIHDAARPFASKKVILRILKELKKYPGVICAMNPVDTVKSIDGNFIKKTLNRDSIILAQTPQGFRRKIICKAYNQFKHKKFTDDAQLLELSGHKVKYVKGESGNFKITYFPDFLLSKQIFAKKKHYKSGLGFDVHKISRRKKDLILGGVKIPCLFSLEAISDGDVVLHALSDGLCGACNLGDIGDYFPPEAKESKGINSCNILKFILNKLHNKYSIENIDITIVAEKPRLVSYKKEITDSLRSILNITMVNVKIKSKEGLDILGGKNSISCFANVLVSGNKK